MVSKVGTVALAGLAGFAGLAQAVPSSQHHPKSSQSCPSLNSSTFVIDEFQLYPENAKFDFNRCLVYFGYVLPMQNLLNKPSPFGLLSKA